MPPRLKSVIHISFGWNFEMNAQKVYYFLQEVLANMPLVLLCVLPPFPSWARLLERTLSLVLVVKV